MTRSELPDHERQSLSCAAKRDGFICYLLRLIIYKLMETDVCICFLFKADHNEEFQLRPGGE